MNWKLEKKLRYLVPMCVEANFKYIRSICEQKRKLWCSLDIIIKSPHKPRVWNNYVHECFCHNIFAIFVFLFSSQLFLCFWRQQKQKAKEYVSHKITENIRSVTILQHLIFFSFSFKIFQFILLAWDYPRKNFFTFF